MASTRTPGIRIGPDGRRFLNKLYRGVRIGIRLGAVTQEQAEHRLQTEVERIEMELERRANGRPLFRDCVARYLVQCREKRSIAMVGTTIASNMSNRSRARARRRAASSSCIAACAGEPFALFMKPTIYVWCQRRQVSGS
jgi:hypothetical protein